MIKFSMRKRVRILDSRANVKGRILQSSKMLDKLSCLFIKTEIGPSLHGPSFASWAKFYVGRVGTGRVGFGPSCPAPRSLALPFPSYPFFRSLYTTRPPFDS